MNRDGTPETEIERWVLKMGLGQLYLRHRSGIGEIGLTEAQVDRLAQGEFDPLHDPRHQSVYDWVNAEAKRNCE